MPNPNLPDASVLSTASAVGHYYPHHSTPPLAHVAVPFPFRLFLSKKPHHTPPPPPTRAGT